MITVPIAAVKQNGSGQDVVRVIDLDHGGKVTEVPVTTGLTEGSYIEITKGLKGDETVIVEVDQTSNDDAQTTTASRRAPLLELDERLARLRRRGRGPRAARCLAADLRRVTSCRSSGRRARASRRCSACSACSTSRPRASIRIGGEDVSALDDATRSRLRGDSIGFVFQQFHLIPHLTALGNVETALLYRDLRPRERRERALPPSIGSGSGRVPTTGRCRCRG